MFILFLIFCVSCAIILLYYSLIFRHLAFGQGHHYESDSLPPVSVVICARDEAENLRKHLKVVFIQHYPKFEVILVNDGSTDHTHEVIAEFASRNDNFRIFTIRPEDKTLPGKKQALRTGILHARHDIVVVTDADCRPASAHWLEHMVGQFLSDTDFVLGYGPFDPEPTWLNKMIRYENVMTAMQYFSYAMVGMPYMGVGRNMAFRRSAFTGWQGYDTQSQMAGGDDDLFVNAVARGRYTETCLHRDSFVYSEAKKTWADWLRQKTRHLGPGMHYRLHHRFMLFLMALVRLIFYTAAPLLFIKAFMLPVTIALCGFVLLIMYLVMRGVHARLHTSDLSSWFILLDPLYTFYLLLLFFLLLFRPKQAWK